MDNPKLYNGTTELTMPMPTSWSLSEILGEESITSLSGQDMVDTAYAKYSLEMQFDTINNTDMAAIQAFLTNVKNNSLNLYLRFDKMAEYANGFYYVNAKLSNREFVAGSGNTLYYVNVSISFSDVAARY